MEIEQLHACARSGRNVVLDDTLCYRWLRDKIRQECLEAGLAPSLLLFAPPEEELFRRHAAAVRAGARPVLSIDRLEEHLETFEWPTPEEGAIPFDARSGSLIR